MPGGTEALHAIQVDKEREVIEFLMGQEYERFPAGALIPFAIRCQAKDSAVFSAQFLAQRQACGETKTVTQASGSER